MDRAAPRFQSIADIRDALRALPAPDKAARREAEARNAELTKPAGALGRLERLAIWVAGWRGQVRPAIERAQVIVFAGNHGVTRRGVSAFPSEVTAQMVANFQAGGAAINRLADVAGAMLTVRPIALDRPTEDFTDAPAMSEAEFVAALSEGWAAVDPAADMVALGEMGIGNTTAAAALGAALFGGDPDEWVGAGASPDGATIAAKRDAVRLGLATHAAVIARRAEEPSAALEILRCFGGRELAAIAGAILSARQSRIPVLLDGFICSAAAAPLAVAAPGALDHCQAAHRSAEAAHGRLLEALGLDPLLDLGLRLGEGSGAALAIPVLRAAVACHSGMATFAEAAVSDRDR